MNVLITGGAGYIGSHCSKTLAQHGVTPVVYDNLSRGHRSFAKWGPLVCGDILDAARLTEVIRQYKPAAVIHFAALAHVGESVTDPAKYFRNNVSGSLTLFETVVMLSSLAMVRIPAVCSAKFVRLRAT